MITEQELVALKGLYPKTVAIHALPYVAVIVSRQDGPSPDDFPSKAFPDYVDYRDLALRGLVRLSGCRIAGYRVELTDAGRRDVFAWRDRRPELFE